jgi:hypothetical protein
MKRFLDESESQFNETHHTDLATSEVEVPTDWRNTPIEELLKLRIAQDELGFWSYVCLAQAQLDPDVTAIIVLIVHMFSVMEVDIQDASLSNPVRKLVRSYCVLKIINIKSVGSSAT